MRFGIRIWVGLEDKLGVSFWKNMKLQIVVTLIAIFSLASCTTSHTETPIETTLEIVQSRGERVLLDYAMSPDGEKLAIYDNVGIYIYTLHSMQRSTFIEFENGDYSRIRSGAVAFDPDGEQIAISGKFTEAAITIWNVKSKNLVTTIQSLPDGYYVTEIEFSPNKKFIIVRNTNTKTMTCQGDIIDKVILHNISEDKNIFEIDKCNIYPPIRFRFTGDERIFFYYGSMSNAYSVYFVESNTGQIISREDLDWDKNGNFYDTSPDGKMYLVEKVENEKRITYLLDSKSDEVLFTVEGKMVFLHQENGFVVSSYSPNPQWSFWEDGKFKCAYDGVQLSPEIKTSANGEVFTVMKSYTELQVWKVSTCEMISELQFDK